MTSVLGLGKICICDTFGLGWMKYLADRVGFGYDRFTHVHLRYSLHLRHGCEASFTSETLRRNSQRMARQRVAARRRTCEAIVIIKDLE